MSVIFNGYRFGCGYKVDMEYLRDFLQEGPEDLIDDLHAVVLVEGWYIRRIPEDQLSSCPKPIRWGRIKNDTCEAMQVFLLTRQETIRAVPEMPKLDETELDIAKRQKFIEYANRFRTGKSFDASKTKFEAFEWKTTTIQRNIQP